MVMLLGLARRTAQQIEKASLRYLFTAMLFPPAIGLRQTHRDHLRRANHKIQTRVVDNSRVASAGIALIDQLVDAVKPVAIAAVPELIVRDQPKLGVDPRPA